MDDYYPLAIQADNVLHMLNLDRKDIASLPDGSVISCNIATPRACAKLIKKLMQELHNAKQSAQDLPNKHTAEKLPTRDTDKLVGGDWNCEHGISHKQCGSCYDQTEPPYLDGLGAYVRSTDYEKLKLENAQLREILAECALDLKEEVAGRYTIEGRIHPAYQDRFDRDMQPVRKAESLLHPNKDSV